MSKVEPKLGIIKGAIYINIKNGRSYQVLGFLVSSSNDHLNGEVLVRYQRVGGACEFARHEPEFAEKFRPLERDNCQFCLGAKGGVQGNENRVRGVVACDYCHAILMDMGVS